MNASNSDRVTRSQKAESVSPAIVSIPTFSPSAMTRLIREAPPSVIDSAHSTTKKREKRLPVTPNAAFVMFLYAVLRLSASSHSGDPGGRDFFLSSQIARCRSISSKTKGSRPRGSVLNQ